MDIFILTVKPFLAIAFLFLISAVQKILEKKNGKE